MACPTFLPDSVKDICCNQQPQGQLTVFGQTLGWKQKMFEMWFIMSGGAGIAKI